LKIVRHFFDFILYSNLFIGLCAVALIFTNQLTIGTEIRFDASCAFVFFATVFTYSYLKFRNTGYDASTPHRNWAFTHNQLSRNVMVLALFGTAAFFLKLNFDAMLIGAMLALVTAFYAFVDIPFLKPAMRLRDFAMLKVFFVALVWSVSTVLIPFVDESTDLTIIIFLLLRRFLFIAALTLVFEIYDMAGDHAHELKTFALRFGVSNTKLASQLMLLLLFVINLVQYFFFEAELNNMLAINSSLLLSIICVSLINADTKAYWYYLVIDGMMLLQFAFVYVANIFS
jgi:4-hydroxybenzoate polyprenyltransferase